MCSCEFARNTVFIYTFSFVIRHTELTLTLLTRRGEKSHYSCRSVKRRANDGHELYNASNKLHDHLRLHCGRRIQVLDLDH